MVSAGQIRARRELPAKPARCCMRGWSSGGRRTAAPRAAGTHACRRTRQSGCSKGAGVYSSMPPNSRAGAAAKDDHPAIAWNTARRQVSTGRHRSSGGSGGWQRRQNQKPIPGACGTAPVLRHPGSPVGGHRGLDLSLQALAGQGAKVVVHLQGHGLAAVLARHHGSVLGDRRRRSLLPRASGGGQLDCQCRCNRRVPVLLFCAQARLLAC